MEIELNGDEDPHSIGFVRWAEETLRAEGAHATSEVGITIVGRAGMAEFNSEYRGKDGPTDVLSLPMFAGSAEITEEVAILPPGEPLLLGDIIICPEVAAENALADGIPLERELRHLCVHGVLHLLGYEHEGNGAEAERRAEQMRSRETTILSAGAGDVSDA